MKPMETPAARRGFLKMAGVTAAAGAFAVFSGSTARAASPTQLKFSDIPGTGDIKVLNYALALEALEADLYAKCVQRLTTGGKTPLGSTINGLNTPEDALDVIYVKRFAKVEMEHRDFLSAALGSASLFNQAPFNKARFNFQINSLNRRQILDFLFAVEGTGVGAYLGAIPFFQTKSYLQIAGAIQGTEARHTAAIGAVINKLYGARLDVAPKANNNNGIDAGLDPDVVLKAVSAYIYV